MIDARGLSMRYGAVTALVDATFTANKGEVVGLLGPNGAGKTTTLRLCLGLTAPDAGNIEVLSHPVPAEARAARTRVGVVPQTDNLDPDFTVEENLLVYARYFGLADRETRRRIPALLEFSGLGGRARSRIQALSGGMKRRLTLARALVNDPDLLFLDEPTTGLDPQARHVIWERLRQLLGQGKTILLTTHFMDEAERLCSRLAIMDHGRIIADGAPRALIERHIEPQVIEAYGDGAERWAADVGQALARRCEKAGETWFCYTRDANAMVHDLEKRRDVRYLHRHANLEDVFLKLTGRELRD